MSSAEEDHSATCLDGISSLTATSTPPPISLVEPVDSRSLRYVLKFDNENNSLLFIPEIKPLSVMHKTSKSQLRTLLSNSCVFDLKPRTF